MSIWNAVLLGLVQGIAEFLPISSSGHLSIVNNLFKMSNDGHMFFDVLLHLGTFISILIVYWQDLKEMVYEVLSFVNVGPLARQPREHYPMARMFLMIVVATLPCFWCCPSMTGWRPCITAMCSSALPSSSPAVCSMWPTV